MIYFFFCSQNVNNFAYAVQMDLNCADRDVTEGINPEKLNFAASSLTFRVPDVFKLLVACMKPDTHVEVVLNASQE